MSNQRSVMTEFRFLDQKRQAEGLTAEEASRYAQLRDLVGPETAGPPRSGFDVNAAAARLRESLLPAGLRARPAEAAPPPPPEPPAVEAPAPEALALEQAWAEAPFAELNPGAADPLFDPGSLAQEVRPQAWNPEAPGYDPDAPYDEAAWIAAGYDPTATYDWSAYGYGPDGQPLAAEGAAAEAAVEGALEAPPEPPPEAEAAGLELGGAPPAPELPELGAPAGEVVEAAYEAEPVDLGGGDWEAVAVEAAPEAWGEPDGAAPLEAAAEPPTEAPWDATFAGEPAEPGLEPSWDAPATEPVPVPELQPVPLEEAEPSPAFGEPAADAAPAEAPLPFDPEAPFDHAKWFGRAAAPAEAPALEVGLSPEPALEVELPPEPAPSGEQAWAPPAGEPEAELQPEPTFELAPEEAAAPAPVAFGEYDEAASAPPPGGEAILLEEAEPAPAEPPPLELPEAEATTDAADADASWLGDALPAAHVPAPAGASFGAYDEAAPTADGSLAAMLSFDPAAAAAIEPGALPEGYEPGGPALDPAGLPPVEGGYDDDASSPGQLYGGPEGDALPGGTPLELGDGLPDWQPEAALEQGFELASDGSFGHGEPPGPRTPAWGTAAVAPPAEGWESAPALDLGAPFEPPPQELEVVSPAAEELPTIDGAELLEELPPEEAPPVVEPAGLDAADLPPAALSLDEESAEGSPLDGAFEGMAEIEAAAYPAPDLVPAFEDLPAEAAPLEQPEPEYLEAAPAPEPPLAELPPEIAAAYGDDPPATALPVADAEPAAGIPVAEAEPLFPEAAPMPEAPGLAPASAAPLADLAEPAAADTFELPPSVAEGLFEPSPEPEPLEAEPPPPGVQIPGTHRVVLHTSDGLVKRGLLVDALLDAPALPLQAAGGGAPEEIPTDAIKAIFFMLSPGEKAPAPEGKKVRVTFRDGRQVAGFSPDYQEGLVGFFMIPADTRTNTGRIWVYQAAVKAVAVS